MRHQCKRKIHKKTVLHYLAFVAIAMAVCLGIYLRSLTSGDLPYIYQLDEDNPLVQTAAAELGEEYGEKYWSWYGFDSRVEWCGCFVSWCVAQNENEYDGEMEPFAYVPSGVQWFQDMGQWKDGDETPEAGDIIFFDWNCSGDGDHVGIVTSCTDGYVFTVEGNSRDKCRRKSYLVGSETILGYGVLK